MESKKDSLCMDAVYKEMTKESMKLSIQTNLKYALAKDEYTATPYDSFLATSIAIRDRLIERWMDTQQRYHKKNVKRVYYLSMEFLLGRLLGTNIINLGLWNQTGKALSEVNLDLEDVRNLESDTGLGNGGLGRLAACFLDSMSTLGIPAHGYGIRYEYGMFNQKIVNGYQVESPDMWLSAANPWEFPRQEYEVQVKFGGSVHMYNDAKGNIKAEWVDTDDIIAMPYDIPVPGFKNDIVNTLRLWSARSTEEFDLSYFNHGDYERAVYNKVFSENISKVLYPNDSVIQGVELRLKQEYFFTAASLSDIIRRFKAGNTDIHDLHNKAAIHLNDTHPAIAIAELMRILIDEEKIGWDEAWNITVNTIAYTNHTIMPEALESWSVDIFEKLLPRHLQIIYEINYRFLQRVAVRFPGDNDRLRRMSIIWEGNPKRVRMGYLAVVGSHSVNGVSELHSSLIKTTLFKDFYEFFPERFNNKTNGITQRRWLYKANTKLSDLITDVIGDKWITDLYHLRHLSKFRHDPAFVKKWQDMKMANKKALASYIKKTTGVNVSPESLFDVQIKRIHEYKRQILFCLYILSQYIKMKKNPAKANVTPRTFILGGKAPPGYVIAKLIVKFITSIADVVNRDKEISDKLKVVFLENYRVSLAERIFPASELSEQISTAGTEASGTSCMKFMVNGALTIGTFDGANIEIAEAVGVENIFLFGLKAQEIRDMRARGYDPQEFISQSPMLKEIFDLIKSNFLSQLEFGLFEPILNSLLYKDYYCVCADFESYCATQESVSAAYQNRKDWTKRSILNVARSGKFSSDRTIKEYANEIWHVPVSQR